MNFSVSRGGLNGNRRFPYGGWGQPPRPPNLYNSGSRAFYIEKIIIPHRRFRRGFAPQGQGRRARTSGCGENHTRERKIKE